VVSLMNRGWACMPRSRTELILDMKKASWMASRFFDTRLRAIPMESVIRSNLLDWWVQIELQAQSPKLHCTLASGPEPDCTPPTRMESICLKETKILTVPFQRVIALYKKWSLDPILLLWYSAWLFLAMNLRFDSCFIADCFVMIGLMRFVKQ
jgi:hypothetical protein